MTLLGGHSRLLLLALDRGFEALAFGLVHGSRLPAARGRRTARQRTDREVRGVVDSVMTASLSQR
jgi:hypothetical protein